MKKLAMLFLLLPLLVLPVSALTMDAPAVPDSGREWMAGNTDSLAEGFGEILQKVVLTLRPDWKDALGVASRLICIVLILSVVQNTTGAGKEMCNLAGSVAAALCLLNQTNSMIQLSVQTIQEIHSYGMLLLPVMTAALAAQGGITTSAALYAGTAAFNALLSNVVTGFLIPGVYGYLALSIASCALEEDMLKRLGELVKNTLGWTLKTLFIVFTSYLSLTGVVSGTTDAAALKATKVTISSFVPVVGSVLADASEAVLVSAGLMKNAAGLYGILAVFAIVMHPFIQIGIQYLILRITGAICSLFGTKNCSAIIDGFSAAMGFLLAMTGGCTLMVLVSTVCFMKGAM